MLKERVKSVLRFLVLLIAALSVFVLWISLTSVCVVFLPAGTQWLIAAMLTGFLATAAIIGAIWAGPHFINWLFDDKAKSAEKSASEPPILISQPQIDQLDQFVKSFGWAGDSPKCFLEDSTQLYCDCRNYTDEESRIGEYTINKTIGLTGREQTARLKPIFFADIPEEKRNKNIATVVKWAIEDKGYALPDLRAMQYIHDNYREAESATNPELFKELRAYRAKKHLRTLTIQFAGSKVFSSSKAFNGEGKVEYPTLDLTESGVDHKYCGAYMGRGWYDHDVLLVFEVR